MPDATPARPNPAIVGIGASAGGVTALKQLLQGMPTDSGLAFVVVMHLAPDQPSFLAEVLQSATALPVHQASEDIEVEADHVYVIPPGRHLTTIDSHLRLSPLETSRPDRVAIDHFFETLAHAQGERSIGIILSGMGSDGTLGMGKIKEQGGLTLAQDPQEAEFSSMPQSAISPIPLVNELSPRLLDEGAARIAEPRGASPL